MQRFLRIVKWLLIMTVIIVLFFYMGSKVNIEFQKDFPFFHIEDYASQYIYVVDRETEEVIHEKNAQSKAYPASLTKIMTTILTLEHIDDLSAPAPIDTKTQRDMFANNTSMAGFAAGESVTYRDLLYGTILPSGAEAANSLAIHVAGSVENFVEMMNAKADELELDNTHFTNPEGLDHKEQYTTAADMAKLLDYALDNEDFRTVFTKETYQTTSTTAHPDGIMLASTVLSALDKGEQNDFEIIGGKSGTTEQAGENWATLGLVNNREYISIVMGAPLDDISHPNNEQIADTLKLYKNIKSGEL
ncbi:D-alanyl-D-alanine carboxypeptidase [Virgibacillus sp. NKC19-3]|uniref:D-alanyl-D-alanine carboxypeptidase family protein n=1 Tax=Virgibacillus saliphilus TaxID=2831674 RepID=UPI001C9AE720|nr:serine hydrolase [Virgibacillus sp. NKC19-3]MBY7141955.1 D-alanyl-D-alanine carboxypeptidase [Virgibacillus sp. NKC19-3]